MMWKTVLAGTAVLAISASTAALAQRMNHWHDASPRSSPTAEDRQAFADARLAALKAGLSLTEAQAKNWPAFEQAVRELQKLRASRIQAQAEQRNKPQAQSADPADRLRQRGTAMAETGAALKKLSDALDPLYKSLDESQKRRFAALSRFAGQGDRSGPVSGREQGRSGARGQHDPTSRGDRFGRNAHGHGGHAHHQYWRGHHGPHGRGSGRQG